MSKDISAAPVSGQGATCDTNELRTLLDDWRRASLRGPVSRAESTYAAIFAHIDSRPRSEDSRAKVLEIREALAKASEKVATSLKACVTQDQQKEWLLYDRALRATDAIGLSPAPACQVQRTECAECGVGYRHALDCALTSTTTQKADDE